jgi:hypothetical protein
MLRKKLARTVFLILFAAVACSQQLKIKIKPLPDQEVSYRPSIEGVVSDPKAEVWVIVHPMEIANYFVQARVSVKDDGKWKGMVFIGRSEEEDIGKDFEIMAVANPDEKINQGDTLPYWPKAQAKSDIIEVKRK